MILSLEGPVRAADTAEEVSAGRTVGCDLLVAGLQSRATHVVRPPAEAGVQLAIDPLAARALFGVPAGQISASMTQVVRRRRVGRSALAARR